MANDPAVPPQFLFAITSDLGDGTANTHVECFLSREAALGVISTLLKIVIEDDPDKTKRMRLQMAQDIIQTYVPERHRR
jgi:uncharacterized protein YcnI